MQINDVSESTRHINYLRSHSALNYAAPRRFGTPLICIGLTTVCQIDYTTVQTSEPVDKRYVEETGGFIAITEEALRQPAYENFLGTQLG